MTPATSVAVDLSSSRLEKYLLLYPTCPTCETNFRTGVTETGAKLEVLDISDLVAESMGLPTLVVDKLDRLSYNMKRSEQKENIEIS